MDILKTTLGEVYQKWGELSRTIARIAMDENLYNISSPQEFQQLDCMNALIGIQKGKDRYYKIDSLFFEDVEVTRKYFPIAQLNEDGLQMIIEARRSVESLLKISRSIWSHLEEHLTENEVDSLQVEMDKIFSETVFKNT